MHYTYQLLKIIVNLPYIHSLIHSLLVCEFSSLTPIPYLITQLLPQSVCGPVPPLHFATSSDRCCIVLVNILCDWTTSAATQCLLFRSIPSATDKCDAGPRDCQTTPRTRTLCRATSHSCLCLISPRKKKNFFIQFL